MGRRPSASRLAPLSGLVRRAREADPITVALIGLPVLVFVVMAWQWRWTHDDGFITLRVVDQVFAGNGPVYNAGQRVEVYTSPLHVFMLVVARGLFGWAFDQAWLGVIMTLGSAVGGMLAACAGASCLVRASGAKGRLLPLGVIVPAVLPPMWEYGTSGLETGIAIGWVGLSFWLVARLATAGRLRDDDDAALRVWPVAMVVGLGPLVRPECTILTIGFLVVLLMSDVVGDSWRARLRLLGTALAIPFAYEIFRMGYFAAMVPNTALAKEAGGSRWDQGWYYLVNFAGPYFLIIPIAVFGVWLAIGRRWSITRSFGGRDGRNLAAVMAIGAVVHTVYVVKVGGDYMHARMLLIPMFALCCPLAVVPQPKTDRAAVVAVACVASVGGWALLVGLAQRAPDPEGFFGGHSIAEQRVFYSKLAGNPHPVTLDEWSSSFLYLTGSQARQAKAEGRDVLITDVRQGKGFRRFGIDLPPETELPKGSGTVVFIDGIGVVGMRAGVDVPIIDLHGLADPFASRTPALVPRGLPGHEKALPQEWALGEAGSLRIQGFLVARTCADDLRRLRGAIEGELTVRRFLENLTVAPGLTSLELSKDDSSTAGCLSPGG